MTSFAGTKVRKLNETNEEIIENLQKLTRMMDGDM